MTTMMMVMKERTPLRAVLVNRRRHEGKKRVLQQRLLGHAAARRMGRRMTRMTTMMMVMRERPQQKLPTTGEPRRQKLAAMMTKEAKMHPKMGRIAARRLPTAATAAVIATRSESWLNWV